MWLYSECFSSQYFLPEDLDCHHNTFYMCASCSRTPNILLFLALALSLFRQQSHRCWQGTIFWHGVTRTSDPEGTSVSDMTVSDRSICFMSCWPYTAQFKKNRLDLASGLDLVKSISIISFPIVLAHSEQFKQVDVPKMSWCMWLFWRINIWKNGYEFKGPRGGIQALKCITPQGSLYWLTLPLSSSMSLLSQISTNQTIVW